VDALTARGNVLPAPRQAVNAAVATGLHMVVAAGNSADDACAFSPASANDVRRSLARRGAARSRATPPAVSTLVPLSLPSAGSPLAVVRCRSAAQCADGLGFCMALPSLYSTAAQPSAAAPEAEERSVA
jgi:subtilisin family serine protease